MITKLEKKISQLNIKTQKTIVLWFLSGLIMLFIIIESHQYRLSTLSNWQSELEVKNYSLKAIASLQSHKNENQKTLNPDKFLDTITQLSKHQGIEIKRIQNSEEGKTTLWISEQNFKGSLALIYSISSFKNVNIPEISITKVSEKKPGVVNIRLSIQVH